MSQMGPTNRPEQPTAMGTQMVLCPYCGSLSTMAKQCNICSGYFDLLSRQRSQNAMGPWFIRDLSKPFQPGCSYATLVRMAQRGKIRPDTVLRGPSTRQFWSFARQTPGVANLLGECHACHKPVTPTSNSCPNCKASFLVPDDRQVLGLSPVHLLPGDADAETIARSLSGAPAPLPPQAPVPVPAVEPEAEPAPIDSGPVPEPQVIVEEPEWIEDEEAEEDGTAGRLGVVIAVLVFVVMMSGAGVWAWLHLSSRADEQASEESQAAPVVQPPEQGLASEGGEVDEGSEPSAGMDSAIAESDADQRGEQELVESGSPDTSSSDAADVPTGRPTGDPQRLAYDRILDGLSGGTLDEAEFEAQLAGVNPARRGELERARDRRVAQIRLGRRGD